jgi:MFS family permease
MLPLGLFRSRNFSAANASTFALYAGLGAFTFFLTIFIQQVGGFSATEAGTALAPATVIMFFLSRRFGALADRLGPRPFMTVGPLIAAGGLLWLMRADADVSYFTDLFPAVALFGLGMSMTVAPLTATVLGAVEQRHAGVASGVNNAVARISGLLAVAAIGAVVATSFGSKLDENIAGRTLNATDQRALAVARDRPLAGREDLPKAARASLGTPVEKASASAFHLGIAIASVLMVLAGAIAAVGIESKRRREVEPVGADLAIALHPCPDQPDLPAVA